VERKWLVSIPLWFDSNGRRGPTAGAAAIGFNSTLVRFKRIELRLRDARWEVFQFHSGSIQTGLAASPALPAKGFNSTLVRFKHFVHEQTGQASPRVSIPLWFDSNVAHNLNKYLLFLCFNSTLVRFKLTEHSLTFLDYMVSIPLWFDSNRRRALRALLRRSFNSTLVRFKPDAEACADALSEVSIPLWFDSNKCNGTNSNTCTVVSIPLWFDSNLIRSATTASVASFQFHSGSIQTK